MSVLSIFAPRRFARLLVSDALNVSRDATLMFAMVLSVVPGIAFWYWHEAANSAALSAFGIAGIARYGAPVFIILPAAMIGWVTGFLLLENRDEGTLLALDVTPAGKTGFMSYRVAVTSLITLVIAIFTVRLVAPGIGWGLTLLIAALVSSEAVMAAFILPALARNKVEGLAITKLANIGTIVPLLAIIPSSWRYLGGIVPTFWIGELLGLSNKAYLPMPVVMALAIVIHGLVMIWLYRINLGRAG